MIINFFYESICSEIKEKRIQSVLLAMVFRKAQFLERLLQGRRVQEVNTILKTFVNCLAWTKMKEG